VGCVLRARADMESASARRQSLRTAGVELPEGLSASCAVGVTRGAMVGDQSWRKAREGWSDRAIRARFGSSCQRAVTMNIRGNSYRLKDKLKAGLVRSHDDNASQQGGEI
jgi:hypothetical protein